jgi:hypothetical protein
MSALRKWFGPSREEVWRKLCAETNANYVEGSGWKRDKVQTTHGEWTITLDTFVVSTGKTSVRFTRLRGPYVNPDGFRFGISRHGFFSDIAKFFGMQDVEVGHADFDRDFIIKGTDREKLRALFSNAKIRELITAQPQIHFEVRDNDGPLSTDFPVGTDELRFHVRGTITDVERLKLLFDLFAETLDELCRMGSAYETDPKVSL